MKGATPTTAAGGSTATTTPSQQASSCLDGKLVTAPEQDTADAAQVILPDFPDKNGHHQVCYVLSNTIMTGRNVGSAEKAVDPRSGVWQVNVHFKNNEFVDKIGTKLVGKYVAIVLDHVVYSAPQIREQITDAGRDDQRQLHREGSGPARGHAAIRLAAGAVRQP